MTFFNPYGPRNINPLYFIAKYLETNILNSIFPLNLFVVNIAFNKKNVAEGTISSLDQSANMF